MSEIINENDVSLVENGDVWEISTRCTDIEQLFMSADNFLPLIKRVKDLARNLVADVHTKEGYKARKSLNAKLAKLKNAIEDQGKKVAAELKAKPKRVDATRKTLKDTFEMLQAEVMAPIKEIEARQEEIVSIQSMPSDAIGCNSIACQQVIDEIEAHRKDESYWQESWTEAKNTIDDAIRQVMGIKALAEKDEAEKAELERLRAQQVELERAAKEKAEAEKRAAEEELRKAKEEAERAKREAEEAKKVAAEAQAMANVDCGEADAAKTRDQMLFPDDDREYKRMVNREVLEDLMKYGISEAMAKRIIVDIVHGAVRHVRVMY